MIRLEIPETKRILNLPEELAECDGRQFAEACNLIYLYQTDQLSLKDFRVQMIYKLLDLKKGTRNTITENEEDEMYSNIYQLSLFIDSFFYKKENGELAIKLHFINNHTPSVKHFGPTLFGPEDEFNDVTFGQYVDALNIYYMIEAEPSKELMCDLMSIFYLPKKKKYSPKVAEKYVGEIRNIHFGKVFGFYLLFASFQTYLFSANIFYQGQELDLSILFKDEESDGTKKKDKNESKIPGIGMKSIEFQMAESGVFGPLEEVKKANFWEIILRLYDIRKRDLDHEAERKKEEQKAKAKNK